MNETVIVGFRAVETHDTNLRVQAEMKSDLDPMFGTSTIDVQETEGFKLNYAENGKVEIFHTFFKDMDN